MTDRERRKETNRDDDPGVADRTPPVDGNGADQSDETGTELTYEGGGSPIDADGDTDTDGDGDSGVEADPLGDLATAAADRADADRAGSGSPDVDDLFDRQEGAAIDADRLWERLEPDDVDAVRDELLPADREVRDVDKRSYCQNCEHFSAPPDVACSHRGTEILAVPTITTFRVSNCPFVREDELLEDTS